MGITIQQRIENVKKAFHTFLNIPFQIRCAMVIGMILVSGIVQPHIEIKIFRFILTILFQALIIIGVISLVIRLAKGWIRELAFTAAQYRRLAIFMGALSVAGLLFLLIYTHAEQNIKIYAPAEYWRNLIEGRELIAASIPEYLNTLRTSLSSENNGLPNFFLILWSHFFGVSYTSYVTATYLFYYLPTCFLLALFAVRLTKCRQMTPLLISIAICTASADFLWSILKGYQTIAGVLAIALLLNTILDWDASIFDWKKSLVFAALTLCAILTQFWLAIYLIVFAVFYVFYFLAIKKPDGSGHTGRDFGALFLNYAVIAGACALLCFVLNPSLFTSFSRNFAIQSGFSVNNLLGQLRTLVENNSILMICIELIGFFALVVKDKNARPMGILLCLTALLSLFWLGMTQTIYNQHSYIILPTLLIFVCGLVGLAGRTGSNYMRQLVSVPLCLVCAVNFSFAHFPAFSDWAYYAHPVTTAIYSRPQKDDNYTTLQAVTKELVTLTMGTSQKVYVLGEDNTLSPELLRNAQLPRITTASTFVLHNNSVDLRDGFPSQLFLADYIVLTDPYADDLFSPQQVSYQVYDLLLNDSMGQEYYSLISERKAGDRQILVFEKTLPTDLALVENLSERLKAFYPDQPFVYQPDYFLSLLQIDPSTSYQHNYYWNSNLILQKQYASPIIMEWNTEHAFSTLSFTLSCWETNMRITLEDQNGVIARSPVEVAENYAYSFDITGSDFVRVTLAAIETDNEKPVSANIIMGHTQGSALQ